MLGTAKADALCSQLHRLLRVSRSIRVRADLHGSVLVRQIHNASELARDGSVYGRDHAIVDISCGSVDGNVISLMELLAAQGKFLILLVHHHIAAAGYAALAHSTGHYGCVGGHAAAHGQDTLCGLHAGDVLRRGLQTYQDNLLSSACPFHSVLSCEHDLAAGRSRGSSQALAQRSGRLQGRRVKLRMKQGVQVTRIDHRYRFFLSSHALVYQIAGNLQSRLSGSLSVTCLKHVQLSMLYGKLHILHVSVVLLQNIAYFLKLLERLREFLFHLGDVHRGTNAGNHVLALRVGKELTEQSLCSGSRVAGECHAGAAVVAHISKGHHLYVDSGSPGVGNIVVAAVYVRSGVVPGTEHGLHCANQLLLRVRREIRADLRLVLCLELSGQLLQIVRRQLYVQLHALLRLHLIDELFKIFLSNLHHDVGIHLDKSAVAVPRPARIARRLCQGLHYFLIQSEIQDGVHHTGHGCSCTGTHGNQKRVLFVPEFLSCHLLQLRHGLHDLAHDLVINLSSILVILGTRLCRHRKALRYRQSQACHLGQVRTLAAQQVPHTSVAFLKQIHPFCHCTVSSC